MKRGRLAILSAILLLGSGVGTPRPARAQVTTPGRNTASPPAALIDEVLRKLQTDLCNVEFVFQEVATHYAQTLSQIDDPYLRERALDIQDVTRRVVRKLQGKAPKDFLGLTHPHILLAHNITPSDTATMNRQYVLGLATDLGSRTSHTAIMARSLNIPAVVGLHDAS